MVVVTDPLFMVRVFKKCVLGQILSKYNKNTAKTEITN